MGVRDTPAQLCSVRLPGLQARSVSAAPAAAANPALKPRSACAWRRLLTRQKAVAGHL